MAGLEGIDANSMEVIDALGGTRYVYDVGDRVAKPVVRHTDFIPVARRIGPEGGPGGQERVVDKVRFGLPVGPRILTNARSDNLGSPAWKGLFGKAQHHAMAAISFVVERDAKGEAWRIQRTDARLLVVPALAAKRHYTFASTGNEYDDWGHVQVTADANAFVAQVHDRFVVELPDKAARDAWMDPESTGKAGLMELLRPADTATYERLPIDAEVWTKRDADSVAPRGPPVRWDGKAKARQATL